MSGAERTWLAQKLTCFLKQSHDHSRHQNVVVETSISLYFLNSSTDKITVSMFYDNVIFIYMYISAMSSGWRWLVASDDACGIDVANEVHVLLRLNYLHRHVRTLTRSPVK